MSLTIKNLESALAGESQAHIKYRYFARLARAEGYEEVARIADRQTFHAGVPDSGHRGRNLRVCDHVS